LCGATHFAQGSRTSSLNLRLSTDQIFTPAGAHLPENIGTGPIDVILVELKKSAAK
jgi:hypothetical protein